MKKLIYAIFILIFTSSLAMAADTPGSGLTEDTTPGVDSLLMTIDNPGVTPASRKSTIAQVLGASPNIDPSDGSIEWEDAGALSADGNLTITDSTSATTWPLLVETVTGDLPAKTDAALTYNASTGALGATSFTNGTVTLSGGALTGLTTPLTAAQGGTGVATSTDGGLLVGAGAGAIEALAVGLTTQILVGGGAGTNPAWGTDLPTAATIGGAYVYRAGGADIPDGDIENTISLDNITQITNRAQTDLTGTAWTVTYVNAAGAVTEVALGASGTVLTSNGAAEAPTMEAPPGGGTMSTVAGVNSAGGAVGDVDIIKLDFSAGAYSLTESPATEINVGSRRHKCQVIEDLTSADTNKMFGSIPVAITLVKTWCRYQGTGTTPAQISFEDAGGTAMTTSAALTCIAYSSIPSEGTGLETFTGGNTLIAYEGLRFDVDNTPSPTTDDYEICVEYTID